MRHTTSLRVVVYSMYSMNDKKRGNPFFMSVLIIQWVKENRRCMHKIEMGMSHSDQLSPCFALFLLFPVSRPLDHA